jgi:hypothetical protein
MHVNEPKFSDATSMSLELRGADRKRGCRGLIAAAMQPPARSSPPVPKKST